jgi:hypothetical protein
MIADNQAGPGFGDNALREIEPAGGIEGNYQYAATHAAKECRNPLRAVLPPEHDAVADSDLALHQFGGEAVGQGCQFSVRGDVLAIATMDDNGLLLAVAGVIIDERGQVRAHNAEKYDIATTNWSKHSRKGS